MPLVGADEERHSEDAPTGNGDNCTTYDHTAPTITGLIVPAWASSGFAVAWSAQDNLPVVAALVLFGLMVAVMLLAADGVS